MNVHQMVQRVQNAGITTETVVVVWATNYRDLSSLRDWFEAEGYSNNGVLDVAMGFPCFAVSICRALIAFRGPNSGLSVMVHSSGIAYLRMRTSNPSLNSNGASSSDIEK
jgi:hypothetical protein